MEKELLIQVANTEEGILAEAENADGETADAQNGGGTEPDAEEQASDESANADGTIALQALIADGVKAVLAEMGLTEAAPKAEGAGRPRYAGATGGANPPPRAEEDDFMKGFREI